MDVSSEMIHAVLPLFMVGTLGASALWVGLVEGAGEGIALITKVFSGVIADKFGHRKWLVFAGYGLGVISKPLFPLATSMPLVLVARLSDRIGKGLRGAPRDAIIADVTPKKILGAAYGLRQSLDSAGAFIGPLIATLLLLYVTSDFRLIFWVALIPGILCLLLIIFGVEEKAADSGHVRPAPRPLRDFLSFKSAAFRSLLLLGVLFSLARFSNAFIVLRAGDCGVPTALIPMAMVGMNLVFSFSSYPFGKLADHIEPLKLLGLGLIFLIASDAAFAASTSPWGIAAGITLWGLHLGASQGIMSFLVAKIAPADRRATAFGVYNFFTGLAMLAAGLIAGVLWDKFGASASFIGGAVFAALSLAMLVFSPVGSAARKSGNLS
jgi:MFS family permease